MAHAPLPCGIRLVSIACDPRWYWRRQGVRVAVVADLHTLKANDKAMWSAVMMVGERVGLTAPVGLLWGSLASRGASRGSRSEKGMCSGWLLNIASPSGSRSIILLLT